MDRRTFLATGAALCGLGLVRPALALTTDEAKSHVSATVDELKALLRISGTADSRAPELRRIMETRANVPLIARFAAGRAWREMSEAQQAKFVDAYARFLSVTYARRFDEYSGDPDISIGRAIDAGKKGILVESPIGQPNGQPIAVEWLVSDRGGQVEIVDIIIEGVSMAATQRDEIGQMLQTRGGDVEALIRDLGA